MSARNLNFRRVFEKYLLSESLRAGESTTRQSLPDLRPLGRALLQCTFRVSPSFGHLLIYSQKDIAWLAFKRSTYLLKGIEVDSKSLAFLQSP
jgi:hypothetical protein